jgi:2-desacetyl-2-hydroxyethyl bacteriochlorophyllide A dehydrogenase
MTEMTALVFEGPGRMTVGERPRPELRAGHVAVDVTAAGICGSELTSFTGHSTRRAPGRVFGHEIAGTITKVGSGAPTEVAGQPVAVNPLIPCGQCSQCVAGRTNACPNRILLGMQVDGGFAEEVVVPYSAVRPLDELDDVAGTLVEPIANAVHVLELLPAATGRHIAVVGAGAIGLSVVSVLRVAGAATITVIDPVEPRRHIAQATGADAALSPEDPAVAELTADHVVDAVGVTGSRNSAIELCDAGGMVVLLGLHSATSELSVNAAIAKELTLQCSYAYTAHDFDTALELLKRKLIRYESWISERPLAEGQAAFESLVERPDEVTKVILRPALSPA